MKHATTEGEVRALISEQDNPVLVQFGKHDCPRCGPFTDAVEALKTYFTFEHLMVTVTNAPELVDYFGVCKLPAFVLLYKTDMKGELIQAAVPEQLQRAVREKCRPNLCLSADF